MQWKNNRLSTYLNTQAVRPLTVHPVVCFDFALDHLFLGGRDSLLTPPSCPMHREALGMTVGDPRASREAQRRLQSTHLLPLSQSRPGEAWPALHPCSSLPQSPSGQFPSSHGFLPPAMAEAMHFAGLWGGEPKAELTPGTRPRWRELRMPEPAGGG